MSRHRIFSTESILSLMVINTFKKNRQVYWFVLLIKHIGKCRSSIKSALKELDEAGLLVRRSGGFSKPNHLYIKIPVEEIYQKNRNSTPLENRRSYKQSLHSQNTGSLRVKKSTPNKVIINKNNISNKELNYECQEGESLWWMLYL